TTTLRVVRMPRRHQQGTQVRVADTQLTELAGGVGDRLGREVREADRDVHRGDDELDRLDEQLRVERAVLAQELHQVQRGQVAAGVVQVHVLRARVRRGDPTGLRARVPVVDRVVVLQTGVGAFSSAER